MNKTILLTGATDGIGLETAKIFAKHGYKLLLHGRNLEKLKKVKQELLIINNDLDVKLYLADLSLIKNTITLAHEILNSQEKIDVIINNAGVFVADDTMTQEGLDIRFAVNTISPYILTKLLLPILSKNGRVINVSSAAQTNVDFNSIKNATKLSHDVAYAQSKLAIIMWGMELAQDLGENAVVVSINPKSFLDSKMVQVAYGRKGYDLAFGANILYKAAVSDEFADKTGKYYDNDYEEFAQPHSFALNKENRINLINVMDDIIERIK
ncbi:MAG: hypothetical protein BEN18_00975 [Epulopiscium sp. Nuni2H_MBin001]|nr:MAG: hypothetical protein BEN18_00975 [Epulopiscium sp. Nuni2H_MBin001]